MARFVVDRPVGGSVVKLAPADLLTARDKWTESHRKPGESIEEAHGRFWTPEAKALLRELTEYERDPDGFADTAQKEANTAAVRKWAEQEMARLDAMRDQIAKLDEPKKEPMPTQEDFAKLRDEWVAKHKKTDESDAQARARYWSEHPEAKEASRMATAALDSIAEKKNPADMTVGEMVTKAIENRARQYHLDLLHGDKTQAELRTEIRKANPSLKELERSDEKYATVSKSADPVFRFVEEWAGL